MVPSSAVQRQHGKGILAHLGIDFLQMRVHDVEIGVCSTSPTPRAGHTAPKS
jgi:hypothetical protein